MKRATLIQLFTATAFTMALLASYSQLRAGPYYYGDEGGGGYSGSGRNGHIYAGGMLGLNIGETATALVNSGAKEASVSLDNSLGFVGSAKLGYIFPEAGLVKFMVEGEILYTSTAFEGLGAIDGKAVEVEGNWKGLNFMLNGLVRFDLGAFEPYTGLGIGFAKVWTQNPDVAVGGNTVEALDIDEWGWAWQFILGGELMMFSDRIGLFTEYKFLSTMSISEFEEFRQHLLGVGLRVHF